MPVSEEYRKYIQDCLSRIKDIRIRSMMGGYLIYFRDRLAGDIGDGMLLVKSTPSSDRMLAGSPMAYPYEESRTLMHVIEDPEDTEFIRELFEAMYSELPEPKQKHRQNIPRNSSDLPEADFPAK